MTTAPHGHRLWVCHQSEGRGVLCYACGPSRITASTEPVSGAPVHSSKAQNVRRHTRVNGRSSIRYDQICSIAARVQVDRPFEVGNAELGSHCDSLHRVTHVEAAEAIDLR